MTVERTLEDVVETVEVPLPAVVSVTPDIALPRIPGMKDILAAGKKPMNVAGADGSYANAIEVVDCKAPEQADRKLEIDRRLRGRRHREVRRRHQGRAVRERWIVR